MVNLVTDRSEEEGARPSLGLTISGVDEPNTAARFWCARVDEVSVDFPECVEIELSAPTSGTIDGEFLHPERELERALQQLEQEDFRESIRDILAEMELFGPPAPVMIAIREENAEILSKGLPIDCVDADVFPYLVAWLLEWSHVAVEDWNNEMVKGSFDLLDEKGNFAYDVELTITREHLSEGLYRHMVLLRLTSGESG